MAKNPRGAQALAAAISLLTAPPQAGEAPRAADVLRGLFDRLREEPLDIPWRDIAAAMASPNGRLKASDAALAADVVRLMLERLPTANENPAVGHHDVEAIAQALSSLLGSLAAEDTPRAADVTRLLLDRLRGWDDLHDAGDFARSLSSIISQLAPTNPAFVAEGANLLIDRLRKSEDRWERPALAEALLLLASQTGPQGQAKTAELRETILAGLAWSMDTGEAVAWARALAAAAPTGANAATIGPLAEALRYPMAGGEPTAVLLATLKALDRRAPGVEVGLRGNLEWLQRDHPETRPFAPVACREPARREVSAICPSPIAEGTQDFWGWLFGEARALLPRWW
jgi:hypothetical protein